MHKYRQEFSSILNSSSSNLTKSRFKRLFFMSSTLILIVLPVQFYVLYQNTSFPIYPFDWSAIHGPSRSDIIMVPTGGIVYYDHWIHIAVGFAVFFFFGLGKDAVNMYRTWLLKAKLGSIFPGLYRELPNARNHSTSTRAGSLTTRARMLFAKKRSSTPSL